MGHNIRIQLHEDTMYVDDSPRKRGAIYLRLSCLLVSIAAAVTILYPNDILCSTSSLVPVQQIDLEGVDH